MQSSCPEPQTKSGCFPQTQQQKISLGVWKVLFDCSRADLHPIIRKDEIDICCVRTKSHIHCILLGPLHFTVTAQLVHFWASPAAYQQFSFCRHITAQLCPRSSVRWMEQTSGTGNFGGTGVFPDLRWSCQSIPPAAVCITSAAEIKVQFNVKNRDTSVAVQCAVVVQKLRLVNGEHIQTDGAQTLQTGSCSYVYEQKHVLLQYQQ